jgi:hypothetical protein
MVKVKKKPYTIQITAELENEVKTLLFKFNKQTGVNKGRLASEYLLQALRAKDKLTV